jgi:replication factor C subunit 1
VSEQFAIRYNSSEHPVAFHRGTDLGAPIKKIAARDAPDVEEAFDVRPLTLPVCLSLWTRSQLEDEILDDEEDIKPKAKDKGINDKLVKEKKPKATKAKEQAEKKTKAK